MTKTAQRLAGANQDGDREANDLYTTPAEAVEDLLKVEAFRLGNIWEPASGLGHIANVLEAHGFVVMRSDLIDYGDPQSLVLDFLSVKGEKHRADHVITNPPYKHALEFVKTSLASVPDGGKVALFLRLTFLEGERRGKFFADNPPIRVHVFSRRVQCLKAGETSSAGGGGMTAYAWFIWEKGYKGETVVKWI